MASIPFKATIPLTLEKIQHTSDERGVYITLAASDTGIDYQFDRMEKSVLEHFVNCAKEGTVKLRRTHNDPFYIAKSVDGKLVETPDGNIQFLITFKAEDVGNGFYPEILHLIKLFKEEGNVPMQASVGGWITDYETTLHSGRPVRIIKKAVLEHVALTPPDSAVNPRTKVLEVLVKSFVDAIQQFEGNNFGINMRSAPVESKESEQKMEKVKTVKDLLRDLEKCSLERRRLGYTKKDIEGVHERFLKFGIAPSPLGNIIKPEIYIDLDEHQFADPVNYFFPLTKEYIAAGIEFARQHPTLFLSLYDTQSATSVYTNLVKSALENNIDVKFTGAPVDALLPEDIASKLEGFNTEVYNLMKNWVNNLQDYYMMLVSGLYDDIEYKDSEECERLLQEMEKRAEKYGYLPAPNAKLKPHKLFKDIPLSKFADPVGLLFPISSDWVVHSYRAFRYTPVRHLYPKNAQQFIYGRILKGLERIGALLPYEPDFELNKAFARRPVFINPEDALEDAIDKDGITVAPTEDETLNYTTTSQILTLMQLNKTMEELEKMATREETDEKDKETLAKGENAADTITSDVVPKFPFVIGARFKPPKRIGVFSIHKPFEVVYESGKTTQSLPLGLIAARNLISKLGLHEAPELKTKEIKLRWVGPDKLKTPIAVVDGADLGGKELKDKVPEVGFKVVGGLQALHKGEVINEWVVLSNGVVVETTYVGWNTPVILRKSGEPILDLAQYIGEELKESGVATGDAFVLNISPNFVVWSSQGQPFITPIRILDDGTVKVYNAKVPAVQTFVPSPQASAEATSHVIQAIITAIASQLGEDHEWVAEAEKLYAAEEEEGEEVEEIERVEKPEDVKEEGLLREPVKPVEEEEKPIEEEPIVGEPVEEPVEEPAEEFLGDEEFTEEPIEEEPVVIREEPVEEEPGVEELEETEPVRKLEGTELDLEDTEDIGEIKIYSSKVSD